MELCKRLLDEVGAYIEQCEDTAERLELQMMLTVILERVRDLNMRCVP